MLNHIIELIAQAMSELEAFPDLQSAKNGDIWQAQKDLNNACELLKRAYPGEPDQSTIDQDARSWARIEGWWESIRSRAPLVATGGLKVELIGPIVTNGGDRIYQAVGPGGTAADGPTRSAALANLADWCLSRSKPILTDSNRNAILEQLSQALNELRNIANVPYAAIAKLRSGLSELEKNV
jgi:hypothetical protein